MSARCAALAILLMAGMGVGAAAEPLDCGAMPITLRSVQDAACSIVTRFDYDAFHVNQHYKRFSVPSAVMPGVDSRGVIHELTARGPNGETLYAARARARDSTHIRFMDDLEEWAAAGWLPWRRAEDRDWSATRTVTTAAGNWYYARFSLGAERCVVVQRYQTLHENGFRYAVIAAACRAGAAYGEAEARSLIDSVRLSPD